MATWKKTDKWKPASSGGGSQGFPVECEETGELGLAKPLHVYQEILAYRFAAELGLGVPEARLDTAEGKNCAISLSWGAQSMDVTKFMRDHPNEYASPAMEAARKKASGLVALHAWSANSDHKNDHVCMRPGPEPSSYELASVDWAAAFGFIETGGPIAINGPPVLMDKAFSDSTVLEDLISRIEGLTPEKIEQIVNGLPDAVLPPADKKRIVGGLNARRANLREAFRAAGWLPDKPAGAGSNA